MKVLLRFTLIFIISTVASAQENHDIKWADRLEYVGVAVKEPNYHIWGSSPVIGPDGKVHVYLARWERPVKDSFGGLTKEGKHSGWTSSSEIAHYIGDSPEGPFDFIRVAVPDQDGDFNSPHNPTISFIDGKYVLCFIMNSGDATTQRIMMYVAEDLEDHWRPAEGAEPDGTMLRQSVDSTIWDYHAFLGNSNPCLIKHDDKYKLYFKAVIPVPDSLEGYRRYKGRTWTYGIALAEKLEGPYIKEPHRITETYHPLEDACIFPLEDKIVMLSRDMNEVRGGGGMLWTSDDGMRFDYNQTEIGFYHLDHYIGEESASKLVKYRGEGNLERPQILFMEGKPAYLFVATGLGYPAPYGSYSHIFKIK